MRDFLELSLNDINISEIPEMPSFLNNNNIMECETIEILFINLYIYENSNITFDELLQKLIEFYFYEANHIMIYNHLRNIAFEYIYQSNDNINMIMIEFINSYHGTEYLKDIYNMNCSYY